MGYEEAVRTRHALEQALREFLILLSAMSREEIELAMGRLADALSRRLDAFAEAQFKTKGQILKTYLDLRRSQLIKQSRLKRFGLRGDMKRYFADCGMANHAQALIQYEKTKSEVESQRDRLISEYRRAYQDWESQIRRLPFLKRLFKRPPSPAIPDLPNPPDMPPPINDYVSASKKGADMSEFLIASVSGFELMPAPNEPEMYSQANIRLLAS